MALKFPGNQQEPIGATLNRIRVEVLGKGLREMAQVLEIAPAHLTDIEKGRRTPSEDLMLRIARHYKIDEAELRAGWNRADSVVGEVATQNPANAKLVPEFLRTARDCSPEQWKSLIETARRMTTGKK